jgi:hypothetical protein
MRLYDPLDGTKGRFAVRWPGKFAGEMLMRRATIGTQDERSDRNASGLFVWESKNRRGTEERGRRETRRILIDDDDVGSYRVDELQRQSD